jgi:hypothetical protein
MTLKSLSTKLFLGIAIAALVMWIGGVPGRTILSLAAVGFMIAMHAGGRGGHGGHGGHGGQADRHDGAAHAGHAGRATSASSSDAPAADAATGTRSGSGSGACH